jgi:hypothetical protein
MFAEWGNFYALVGQAAATLIGLLFVIVTLGAAQGGTFRKAAHLFVTPTLVHFGAVFFVAMLVLAPDRSRLVALYCLLAVGLIGLAYVAAISGKIFSSGLLDPSDSPARMFFVPLPALGYLLIVVGSMAALAGRSDLNVCIAAASAILLVVGIRNAWAMALFSVEAATHSDAEKDERRSASTARNPRSSIE